jgi:hypothetical protein
MVVNGFGVTGHTARFVFMCKKAVLEDGDNSVQEIGSRER